MKIDVGDEAPDFTLPDMNKHPVPLAGFVGHKAVLLVFYPFAFSSVCSGELGALRENLSTFQNEKVQVLALSTDPTFSLKAWAQAQRFDFPLLSDFWPHGQVAKSYGVFDEQAGMAVRGTFLIDDSGTVTFAEVNGPGEPRDQEGWGRAVAALPG